jgi:O-antigen ligase
MGKKQLKSRKPTGSAAVVSAGSSGTTSPNIATSRLPISDTPASMGLLIGAGVVLTLMLPSDSVSVVLGESLPWVAYWMAVSIFFAWLVWKRVSSSAQDDGSQVITIPHAAVGLAFAWLPVLVWAACDVGLNWEQGNARWGLNTLWQWIGTALASIALVSFTTTEQRRRDLLLLYVLGATALAVFGLYQYFVSMPADRAAFERDPVGIMREAGLVTESGSVMYQQFRNRIFSTEPFATFALANSLAIVLASAWMIALVFALQQWLTSRSLSRSLLWLVILFLLGIVLVLTKSRAAWIGAAVGVTGLLASMLWRRKELRTIVGSLAFGLLVVIGVVGWIGYRQDPLVFWEATKSLQYRFEYWIATGSMIADHLLSGVGLGQFQSYYTWYKLAQASESVADPHNWFLELLATTGLIGLVSWGAFIWILRRWCSDRLAVAKGFQGTQDSGSANLEQSKEQQGALKQANLQEEATERSLPLFVGAGLGIPLALVLGLPVGRVPDLSLLVPVMLGLVVAVICGVVEVRLRRARGDQENCKELVKFPESDFVLWPLMVCFVSMLAAGGWMTPGVSLPIWLVLAVGLGDCSSKRLGGSKADLPCRWWYSGVAIRVALIVLFLWSTWKPVMSINPVIDLANSGETIDVQQLQNATEADSIDPRPWQIVARHCMVASENGDESSVQKALMAIDQWLKRDPASAAARRSAGDWVWLLAERHPSFRESLLKRALGLYRDAEARSPNDAGYVLQLAAIHQASGQPDSAQGLAERARKLDESHQHLDRKLARQKIWWPSFNPGVSTIGASSEAAFSVEAQQALDRILQ